MVVYLLDGLIVSSGLATDLVNRGELDGEVAIHKTLIRSLEEDAKKGSGQGLIELIELKKACETKGLRFVVLGDESDGRSPAIAIRDAAAETGGVVVTADPSMARTCRILGIKIKEVPIRSEWDLDSIFKGDVLSLHLKEGVPPRVKRGLPGQWVFEELSTRNTRRNELELFIAGLIQKLYQVPGTSAFIEVDRANSTIIQYHDYRIVITRPPFSDGLEITVVRPIIKRSLSEYGLPKPLYERLVTNAEGILIAGPPGMGKSTFAQSLAEHYRSLGKVVKTIESPRDLQLSPDITQYSKSSSNTDELHDVLLLSRPDYTVFDEMRNEEDFQIYTDLRLAGIGMVGVVHATSPIDAIQRFTNRLDLGVIPSIIDTVIFMDSGRVAKIYVLEMSVRVPRGMRRADLARPTIEVKNFLTGEVEYEMYVFGERAFIVPVSTHSDVSRTAEGTRTYHLLNSILGKYIDDYDLRVRDGVAEVNLPREYMRVYVKKVQRRLLKLCHELGLELEIKTKE
ncbi:MAG: ATPase, T2SS/T4P/T4SS family [Aigarchaeota archaeon]|nr:ATPase, T2SS/T4P/T4SS family [Aigarchaeota archaeon]MDW8092389.1 ATPase, T2SS/T4P/T4SS family [Nitrososphaerota archaeon]